MKTIILLLFGLAASSASVFCGDRHIAFERDQAVWIANLDGTGEKKIVDGLFPAISPDGDAEMDQRCFAPLNMTAFFLAQQLSRFRKRLIELARLFASALRAVRTPTAFSTNDWSDLLNQLVRLNFRG